MILNLKKLNNLISQFFPKQYRILYLSCHSILEFDELKILKKLGHKVFSPGAGRGGLRPTNPSTEDEKKLMNQFLNLAGDKYDDCTYPWKLYYLKSHLTKKFLDNFEIILIMHNIEWIENNWNVLKNKKVIWRSIGQSNSDIEFKLKKFAQRGLKIIRYSPLESNLKNYAGSDFLIRFYKNNIEFSGWLGDKRKAMTISQEMKKRKDFCHYDTFINISKNSPTELFGFGNNNNSEKNSQITYEALKNNLRHFRCYIYTGTYPASYTLAFIEAWMTGIPIIAIGNKLMHDRFDNLGLYEIPLLIKNGTDGFVSDSIEEINLLIDRLIKDKKLAERISKNGRKKAIKFFGENNIFKQWKKFFITMDKIH